jgi:hypothetical protein
MPPARRRNRGSQICAATGRAFIAVERARLEALPQLLSGSTTFARGAVRHTGRICSGVLKNRWGIRQDFFRASDQRQSPLGFRNPARQGDQLGSPFRANNRTRERLDLPVHPRVMVQRRRQTMTQCIGSSCGFARLCAWPGAPRRVSAIGPYSSIVCDHRFAFVFATSYAIDPSTFGSDALDPPLLSGAPDGNS